MQKFGPGRPDGAANAKILGLTDEEMAVLEHLDFRDKQIVEILNIEESSVKECITAILTKLKCSTRTQAALRAIVLGLITPPGDSHGSDPFEPTPVPRKPLPGNSSSQVVLPLPEAEEKTEE